MISIGLILASYLWGSISPSYIIARWRGGIDLRRYGTGTVGGSNVGEQLGYAWMIAAGALDVLKGLLPPLLARVWGGDWNLAILLGLGVVIGHNWSLYLGLRGGRGIGATVGALSAWDIRLAILFLFFLAVGWMIKQGAPSAAIALILFAPSAWVMNDAPEIVLGSALMTLVMFIKRIEANRLPLPQEANEKRAVLLRRLWMDRDVPADQPWQERKRIM